MSEIKVDNTYLIEGSMYDRIVHIDAYLSHGIGNDDKEGVVLDNKFGGWIAGVLWERYVPERGYGRWHEGDRQIFLAKGVTGHLLMKAKSNDLPDGLVRG